MPSLPLSMAKGLKKTPAFNTVLQKVAAGRGNSSTSLTPYPTWNFEFDLDRIAGSEASAASVLASFLGTFMACNGSAQLFLFTDPQDHAVSASAGGGMLNVTPSAAAPMGVVGDGVSTQFQLARSIAGVAWDILQNVSITALYVAGTPKSLGSDYSVSSTGVVTFASAPANGYALTWTGTFQYLCRFSEDTVDASRVFTVNSGTDQWDISSVKFSSEFI